MYRVEIITTPHHGRYALYYLYISMSHQNLWCCGGFFNQRDPMIARLVAWRHFLWLFCVVLLSFFCSCKIKIYKVGIYPPQDHACQRLSKRKKSLDISFYFLKVVLILYNILFYFIPFHEAGRTLLSFRGFLLALSFHRRTCFWYAGWENIKFPESQWRVLSFQ